MIEWTDHPYFPIPTKDQARAMGKDKLLEIWQKREEAIHAEKVDPFHNGIEPEHWQMADEEFAKTDEIVCLGGNRAGKSFWASKRVVKCINDIPGSNVLCMHTTASTSIEQQQQYIWDFIPSEWKQAKKGKVTNMTFSKKGGFTESSMVAPNGSRIFFRNYSQNLDTGILEGSEWDLVWLDELCGIDHINALRFRLVTRANRPSPGYPEGYPWRGMMITFTPVAGYTPTIREYLQGAKTIKEVDADPDLLPGEKVPVVQQPLRENSRVIYFHSVWNKFNDYGALKKTLKNDPRQKILTRCYGVPHKQSGSQFPRFGNAHLVTDEQIPEEGTNYHIVDPSNGKNWVMIWVRVAVDGKCYVYREFPDQIRSIPGVGMAGEWAVPGKKIDGDPGLAQDNWGWSLMRYKQEIETLEGDEEIFMRIMDSRYGNATTPTQTATTSIIEEMADLGLMFDPSIGVRIDEGVTLVNDFLDFDESRPVGLDNSPRLFVHEDCKNLRFAMSTWTGQDGKKGACKDWCDLMRYFILAGATYIDGDDGVISAGGYW